jgi:tRNA A37 methylthiotransferase MiaB
MNISDSEIVASVLRSRGFVMVRTPEEADAILVNTCAIRDGAEAKVWHRLRQLKAIKTSKEKALRKQTKKAKLDVSGLYFTKEDALVGALPVVGVLGCMGERLKDTLLLKDGLVDLVAGPDAYRDLPRLIENAVRHAKRAVDTASPSVPGNDDGRERPERRSGTERTPRSTPGGAAPRGTAAAIAGASEVMNVRLSLDETYADIHPIRRTDSKTNPSAFVSIARGCDNMCAFCVVPFTRGRERSRPFESVLREVKRLSNEGYKEVTLLGQNVNSYADKSQESSMKFPLDSKDARVPSRARALFSKYYADGFASVYEPSRSRDGALRFGELLHAVADVDPEMRVRFTSPHPKDFPDEVLEIIANRPNVGKMLHMPAQSGSSSVLRRMRRGYTREAYVDLVTKAREKIPGVAISSDFIAGFCGETEEEHEDTVSLMRAMKYEQAFMFAYSMREKTSAARRLVDDVDEAVKKRRLAEIIRSQREEASATNAIAEIGQIRLVLIEGAARKSEAQLAGRTCANKRVVIDRATTCETFDPRSRRGTGVKDVPMNVGEYVAVKIASANASTLFAEPLGRTTLREFYRGTHGQ